jgi:uncharacterized protein (TIGR03066 family)
VAAPAPGSNKTKIVGVWEATKPDAEAAATATLEFTRDGKLKVTLKIREQTVTMEATYKVEGDKLVVTKPGLGPNGKETTRTVKLVKLNASELITKDEKGRLNEFKKQK